MYDKQSCYHSFLAVDMDFKITSKPLFSIYYLRSPLQFMATILALVALLSGCASTKSPAMYRYEASPSVFNDVVEAQQRALDEEKLLLVVLGAQWCHDSTGLAQRFESEEMQPILMSHYETVFVDVGMLEDRRNITQRFDYPIYYATPTVMIVDPATSSLMNRASMAMWGRADSIALSDYVEYFSLFPRYTEDEKASIAAWEAGKEEAEYNKQQASRLQNAYDKLGPLLQSDLDGITPEGFYDLWKETKGYRSELQKTLEKRAESQLNNARSGKTSAKAAPALRHYHPFSWESN